jgi:ribonuclease P protein component
MLPKIHRIPSSDLRSVIRYGTRVINKELDVKRVHTACDVFRCAIIVPTRVDKRATKRNRIRRLISESVRHILPTLAKGHDVVIRVNHRLPDTQTEMDAVITKVLQPFMEL